MTARSTETQVPATDDLLPPRPLTAAEETHYMKRARSGRRFTMFMALGFLGAILINAVIQIRRPRDRTTDIVMAVFLTVFSLPPLWFLRLARTRVKFPRRVGRYAGVHTLAGLPVTHLIGPYTVELPNHWNGPPIFALGEVVDVEFTPALEDVPDPGRGRLVLSAIGPDGRRIKAVDPALVGTSAV